MAELHPCEICGEPAEYTSIPITAIRSCLRCGKFSYDIRRMARGELAWGNRPAFWLGTRPECSWSDPSSPRTRGTLYYGQHS